MLSSTRTRSRSREPRKVMQEVMQGINTDALAHAEHEHVLPPEIMSAVFAGMQLKDLVPFRSVR